MTLDDWMKKEGETNLTMALKLGDISTFYVSHIRHGKKIPGPFLALKIEQVTKGEVSATSFRKDARL